MPSARAAEFRRAAAVLGFRLTRQTGSHERWTHPDERGPFLFTEGSKPGRHASSKF